MDWLSQVKKSIFLQVEYILQDRPGLRENRDWKQLYQSLRRRYGLREDFTEVVMLCRKCCALYWQSLGHPCFIPVDQLTDGDVISGKNWIGNFEENSDKSESGSNEWCIPLTPVAFLSFFSIWSPTSASASSRWISFKSYIELIFW